MQATAGPRYGVAGGSAARFARATGVQVSLASYYVDMNSPLSAHYVSWARKTADGAEPVLELMPRKVTLSQVAAGQADHWLRSLGRQITAPVIISFAPEANGPWYAWGGEPQLFLKAYRHVHRLLGTRNITWLWQMSAHPSSSATHVNPKVHPVASYWPGRRLVSWIGLDGYYYSSADSFGQIFATAIRTMRRLGHRPVLLSETAVGPGTAPNMVRDIRVLVRNLRIWHLEGLIWFDQAQHQPPYHQDWNLESRPKAARAFRAAARA
jgi:hypothetical protein